MIRPLILIHFELTSDLMTGLEMKRHSFTADQISGALNVDTSVVDPCRTSGARNATDRKRTHECNGKDASAAKLLRRPMM